MNLEKYPHNIRPEAVDEREKVPTQMGELALPDLLSVEPLKDKINVRLSELSGPDAREQILKLEEEAMNTETTYPLNANEYDKLVAEGYRVYGLKDEVGNLVAKTGFAPAGDNRFELDVSTHPNNQGMGFGGKIIRESIKAFRSEKPESPPGVFLKVHPNNPAIRLYEREGFIGVKDEGGNYVTEETAHGPRIIMDFSPAVLDARQDIAQSNQKLAA